MQTAGKSDEMRSQYRCVVIDVYYRDANVSFCSCHAASAVGCDCYFILRLLSEVVVVQQFRSVYSSPGGILYIDGNHKWNIYHLNYY